MSDALRERSPAPAAASGGEADPLRPRTIYLHRRVAAIAPDRIEIRPPRSAAILPLFGVAATAGLLALIGASVGDLPLWASAAILLLSVLLLPLSGISLVYALLGAHITADRAGRNVSLKQRFLGLGIGTNELIPFWKIREIEVADEGRPIARADGDLPAESIAQWRLTLVKKSGARRELAGLNVPRDQDEEGLAVIWSAAEALSRLSGAPIKGPIW